MSRKRKFIIAGLVLAIVVVGLAGYFYFGPAQEGSQHLTVAQLKAQGAPEGSPVRVGGEIAIGSVDWNAGTSTMRFTLKDEQESLAVIYRGVIPDDFKPGAVVVVEGRYSAGGVLEGSSITSQGSALCQICH